MHQFEAIFGDVDIALFQKFTGFKNLFRAPELTDEVIQTGIRRCGNAHFPANAAQDYDYLNPNPIVSDCEDWHPYGIGQTTSISSANWNDDELNYYTYWMQNVPGLSNGLTNCAPQDSTCVATERLKDWWTFIYDFDNAYRDRTFWEDIPQQPNPVPEPSTLSFLAAGLAAIAAIGRKKL